MFYCLLLMLFAWETIANTVQIQNKTDFTTAGASECMLDMKAGLISFVLDLLFARGSRANE